MGLQIKVTPDIISADEVWNFPINMSYKYQRLVDELVTDNRNIYNDV